MAEDFKLPDGFKWGGLDLSDQRMVARVIPFPKDLGDRIAAIEKRAAEVRAKMLDAYGEG